MAELFLATNSDFREVTDFINMVFDKNFPEFMEKVYTEENFMRAEHYCIRDEGRLAACVAVYPQTIRCGDESIECAWIGSVSVSPDKRGMGYMKQLMAHVNQVLVDRGIPFAYLSGRRNRYGFYGYEITGMRNYFTFEEENIRLTIGFDACNEYEFDPLYQEDKEDLESVMKLYEKRLFMVRTAEDMVPGMKTWEYRPYVVKKKGEFQVYILIKGDEIAEIELVNFENVLNVCGAVMLCFGIENLKIEARTWEIEKCRILAEKCERYHIETLGNMKIFDFKKTLGYFMETERKIRNIKPGKLIVEVTGEDTFSIEVTEKTVKTDIIDSEKADISVTPSQLIRLCFTRGGDFITGFDSELVKNWFPLSYTPERVDEF